MKILQELEEFYEYVDNLPNWRVIQYINRWNYTENNKLVEERDRFLKVFYDYYDKETKTIDDYLIMDKIHNINRLIFNKCK